MTESNRIEYKRELIEGLEKEAVAQGATGYYMVHNHPTGSVTPSIADATVTKLYIDGLPKLKFLGQP